MLKQTGVYLSSRTGMLCFGRMWLKYLDVFLFTVFSVHPFLCLSVCDGNIWKFFWSVLPGYSSIFLWWKYLKYFSGYHVFCPLHLSSVKYFKGISGHFVLSVWSICLFMKYFKLFLFSVLCQFIYLSDFFLRIFKNWTKRLVLASYIGFNVFFC